MEENELYEMSDEELEQAFRDAKAGEVEVDNESTEDEVEENEEETEVEMESEEEEVEAEDEEEEVEVDDTEQPGDDEDSDQEEDKDESEEEPVEELDEEDADNQDEEEEESEPEPKVETFKYKANGQEFEFTEDEIKEQFGKVFGQSMNYTQKMQEIAPWRKTISALKDNELTHEDVNLMIDVLKGDKDAIAAVVKKAGVDTLDLNTEEDVAYAPKEYGRSEAELAIDDVISGISNDQEFGITQHVVDKQWDGKSRQALAENPQMIAGLHNDVKSGVYDKVNPMAMKLKILDGGSKSDLEYYLEAGQQYYTNEAKQAELVKNQEEARAAEAEEKEVVKAKVASVKKRKSDQSVTKKAANKRKAAAPTKKAAGKKDVIDYLNEDSFLEWEKEYDRKYG